MVAWLFWSEIVLAVLFCILSWRRPGFAGAAWKRAEFHARRMTPGTAFAVAFLAPLVIRAALLPLAGIPSPMVMDEFSYLLGADTFAMGRLANPPVPVPEAFRALYVLTTPGYGSIYPPAQAAVMAFGQVVLGHPWWGVFVSVGLMAATTWWMVRGFASQGWALAIALLTGLQLGVFTYWINSYWGGSVAAMGGNLVVGGWARLRTRLEVGPSCALVGGAIVLGLRRPYEGLVLVVVVAALLAWDVAGRRPKAGWAELTRLLAPAAAGVICFAAFTAWYDYRAAGDWRTMPYVAGSREAAPVPTFVFGKLGKEVALPDNIERFETVYRKAVYESTRTVGGYLEVKRGQMVKAFWVFLRPALVPPFLIGLGAIWFGRRWKVGIALAACAAAAACEIPLHVHYLAPAYPVYCLLLLFGFQALRGWCPRGRPFGLALSRSLVLVFGLAMVLSAASLVSGSTLWSNEAEFACCGLVLPHPRGRVEAFLESRPENSLVLVRYGPFNFPHYEFVYNSADLEHAHIVWARDLGPAVTERVAAAFPGRTFWHLDVGMLPRDPVLTPCGTGPGVPCADLLSSDGSR